VPSSQAQATAELAKAALLLAHMYRTVYDNTLVSKFIKQTCSYTAEQINIHNQSMKQQSMMSLIKHNHTISRPTQNMKTFFKHKNMKHNCKMNE